MNWRNYWVATVAAAGIFLSGGAHAVPIVYEGEISVGETVVDQVNPGLAESDWWYFNAVAGQTYRITGHRLEAALDPAFALYFGFGDTDDLFFLGLADDEIPPPPGLEGPFGDPQLIFTAEFTGIYTIEFLSFGSDGPGPDGVFDYQLSLTAIPEPASLGLLGLGMLGLGALGRRGK